MKGTLSNAVTTLSRKKKLIWNAVARLLLTHSRCPTPGIRRGLASPTYRLRSEHVLDGERVFRDSLKLREQLRVRANKRAILPSELTQRPTVKPLKFIIAHG
jgi:hypothetical protein